MCGRSQGQDSCDAISTAVIQEPCNLIFPAVAIRRRCHAPAAAACNLIVQPSICNQHTHLRSWQCSCRGRGNRQHVNGGGSWLCTILGTTNCMQARHVLPAACHAHLVKLMPLSAIRCRRLGMRQSPWRLYRVHLLLGLGEALFGRQKGADTCMPWQPPPCQLACG